MRDSEDNPITKSAWMRRMMFIFAISAIIVPVFSRTHDETYLSKLLFATCTAAIMLPFVWFILNEIWDTRTTD
ncbi:MAG: hypothetical protein AAF292_13810 [Pseudomonadota bacterium]